MMGQYLSKLKYTHALDPAIALSGNCATNIFIDAYEDKYTRNLFGALPQKGHICILEVIQIVNNRELCFKALQYIRIMKYYDTIEKAAAALCALS